MELKQQFPTTVDGYTYHVVSTSLNDEHPELPVAIFVDNQIARLTADYVCPANDGYSLRTRKITTRFFNVYRAADGSICMGKRAFPSNEARWAKEDTERALFGLAVTYNEASGQVTCEKVD